MVDEHSEIAGYALQIKVNAGLSSEYWRFDSDFDEIHDELDHALDDMSEAMADGHREEHLRVVALTVAVPIPPASVEGGEPT